MRQYRTAQTAQSTQSARSGRPARIRHCFPADLLDRQYLLSNPQFQSALTSARTQLGERGHLQLDADGRNLWISTEADSPDLAQAVSEQLADQVLGLL